MSSVSICYLACLHVSHLCTKCQHEDDDEDDEDGEVGDDGDVGNDDDDDNDDDDGDDDDDVDDYYLACLHVSHLCTKCQHEHDDQKWLYSTTSDGGCIYIYPLPSSFPHFVKNLRASSQFPFYLPP